MLHEALLRPRGPGSLLKAFLPRPRPARRQGFWRLGGVRWRTVGASVQWGSALVCFLCTLLPYLIIHARSTVRERAFVVYDADISHPSYPNTVAGAPVPPAYSSAPLQTRARAGACMLSRLR